jgi:GH25 family lysozyme M1 (1,4-beta-N-acetylmuramidase)
MTEGIDVYGKIQTSIDFIKVKRAGREFCYVKVSDGMTLRDTKGYGAAGKLAGLAMGAYHYGQPGDPIAQANLLLTQADRLNLGDLGRALDLEAPFVPGATATDFAIRFLRRIRDAGHLPVFYANDSLMGYTLPAVAATVPEVWPWIARYGAPPKNRYRTWQYSSSGQLPGIPGTAVDLDQGEVPYDHRAVSNTPSGHPAAIREDDIVLALPTCAPIPRDANGAPTAELTGDDYVTVPCDGKTALFVGTGFGRRAKILGAIGVKDNNGKGTPEYVPIGPAEDINPDQPGPIAVGPGCRAVQLRYRADHAFTVWCA